VEGPATARNRAAERAGLTPLPTQLAIDLSDRLKVQPCTSSPFSWETTHRDSGSSGQSRLPPFQEVLVASSHPGSSVGPRRLHVHHLGVGSGWPDLLLRRGHRGLRASGRRSASRRFCVPDLPRPVEPHGGDPVRPLYVRSLG